MRRQSGIGRKALKNRFLVDVARFTVDRNKLIKDFGFNVIKSEEDLED